MYIRNWFIESTPGRRRLAERRQEGLLQVVENQVRAEKKNGNENNLQINENNLQINENNLQIN
jgi:hypothetical protein